MLPDEQHDDTDLFDTSTVDPDSSTSEQSTEDAPTEIAKDTVDLDLKPNKAKQKQVVDSWVMGIKAGTKKLEDLKAKQPWAVPLVNEQLALSNPDEDRIAKLVSEAATKAVEAAEQKRQMEQGTEKFEELKARIKSLNLPVATLQRLNQKFSQLSGSLGDYEALVTAAEVAQVDFEQTDNARRRVSSPKIGYGSTAERELDLSDPNLDPNSMSPAAKLKHFRSMGIQV